jgi:ferrous iron transport protein B
MGALIWLLATVKVDGISILAHVSEFLDPFGRLFGMDGAIVLAFLLGIPASEIVIPILVVIYSSASSIGPGGGVEHITDLFAANGHGALNVACTAIFALFHFPCSTSLITVYKETKSLRLTLLSFLIPTSVGLAICFLLSCIFRIFI